jgi:transcription initiation factor TFIIIB Brf1 subunit/transcription initiation factor TFIIB
VVVTSLTEDYFVLNACDYCNSTNEIYSNGFVVCRDCGTVKEKKFVDHLPVKRDHNNEVVSHNSIGKRIGYVGELGSEIGYNGRISKSIHGKMLNPQTLHKYRRLSKFYHKRSKIDGNATQLRTMVAFNRICNQLGVSTALKQRALFLYWEQVKREIRITNHVLLSALCLLVAVREAKDRAPLRFSEIVSTFSANNHRVTNKNILKLARTLDISLAPVRRTAEDYLERVASAIKWDSTIQKRIQYRPITKEEYELILIKISTKFLEKLDRTDRGGVQPFPFAVSVVYLADRAYAKACERRPILTQKILAHAVNSAEFTIRDHVYRFLGDLYKIHEESMVSYITSNIL